MLTVKKVIERYEPHKPTSKDWDSKEVRDAWDAWDDSWKHIGQALRYAKAAEVFAEEFAILKKGWEGKMPYSEIEEQKIGAFLCGDGQQAGENIKFGREGIEYLKQANIQGIIMYGAVSLRDCFWYDTEKPLWARRIKMADSHNDFVDKIQVMMRAAGIIGDNPDTYWEDTYPDTYPETFFKFVVEHPECREILNAHVERMREMLSDEAEIELQEVGI